MERNKTTSTFLESSTVSVSNASVGAHRPGWQRVRSFSFPRSTPVCPGTFEQLWRDSPRSVPSALLVGWVTWGDLRCMPSPREGECDRSISSCQGSPEGALRGRPREVYRTHLITWKVVSSCGRVYEWNYEWNKTMNGTKLQKWGCSDLSYLQQKLPLELRLICIEIIKALQPFW